MSALHHHTKMAEGPIWLPECPHPPTRLNGSKARGCAYEKKVAKQLATICLELGWTLRAQEWILLPPGLIFSLNCRHLSPDFVLESPSGGVLLLEAKLTYTEDAWPQLYKYETALQAMGHQVSSAQVCRNLTPFAPASVADFEDLYPGALWHLYL